jgi:hypothetical protein
MASKKQFILLVAVFLISLNAVVAMATQEHEPSGFVPPIDEYDWIQLISDEWLKGELISLYDDELTFESDKLGRLSIDWEDVKILRSHGSLSVHVHGLDPLSGKLLVDEQHILIDGEDESRKHSRTKLVSITPSAYRELDNWSANATLGFNIRQGNADTIEYNLLLGLERRTPGSRIALDYLGNFNETEGKQIANNHRLNATWDRFRGNRLFWRPLIGQYFRDIFQNIDHQGTLETGLGYELIDNSRTDWTVSGGLGINYIRYRSVEEGQDRGQRSPAFSLGTNFETELTSWMDYVFLAHVTFLDEDSGSYQHHLLTTLSTELTGRLDLDVSFIWDRIQKPQVRADGTVPEKDDFRLMLGLGFEF